MHPYNIVSSKQMQPELKIVVFFNENIKNYGTMDVSEFLTISMFSLSSHHLEEISHVPKLVALVENNVVHDSNMKEFVRLCMFKNCVQTFLAAAPRSLTVLAYHNGLAMAQSLDFSKEHPKSWRRAARRAAQEGHEEFIDYILTHNNTDDIRKSVVTGACMGDKVKLLQRFAPTIENQKFSHNLPSLAAQLNAVECMRHLLKDMSAKVWTSAMAAAFNEPTTKMIDLLMENVPLNFSPPKEWCRRVAMYAVNTNDYQKVLNLVFQYITSEDLIKLYPRMSTVKKDILTAAYQNVVLSAAVADNQQASFKRKI